MNIKLSCFEIGTKRIWYVSRPKNSGKGIQLRLIKMKYVQVLGLDTALSPALENLMLGFMGFPPRAKH